MGDPSKPPQAGSVGSAGSIGSGSQNSELAPESISSLSGPDSGCPPLSPKDGPCPTTSKDIPCPTAAKDIQAKGKDISCKTGKEMPDGTCPKSEAEKSKKKKSPEKSSDALASPKEEAAMKGPLTKPDAIVLDFFGTTTTRKFVAEVLLPFIKQEVGNYLKDNWSDQKLQKDISRIRQDQTKKPDDFVVKIKESSEPEEEVRKSIVEYINTNIEKKKNHVGANRVMKRIWSDGYQKGKLKTPIFEDVPAALEKWKKENIKVYGFSSNKVDSQKLFYKSTDRGDILQHFADFFDRSTGKKDNPESYRKIATKTSIAGDKILYINDTIKEARAAKQSDLKTVLITRPGNREIKEKYKKSFTCVSSFTEIQFS